MHMHAYSMPVSGSQFDVHMSDVQGTVADVSFVSYVSARMHRVC
jgi:hypothetical protein